tara:strand:+ start:92 stop:433 length:342 start_codon:yes stop_codon:yes gene_type:complete
MRRAFIEEAILNAEKSTLNGSNHGAIIVYRGKIIGHGYNKETVLNLNRVNKWSIHAEVDAINNALRKISKENLKQSTLIVVRVMKTGDISLSAPCRCCSEFIKKCGIKNVYYS